MEHNKLNVAVGDNSIGAYQDIVSNITPRHEVVLYALEGLERQAIKEITDRQLAEACGFTGMNSVRPRIKEVIKLGEILGGVSVNCPVTGKSVRTLQSTQKVRAIA